MNMKMYMNGRFLFPFIMGLTLLIGLTACYGDPMKPYQPNGRRVKVNTRPLPVMPLETNRQETVETQTDQSAHPDSQNPSGGNE